MRVSPFAQDFKLDNAVSYPSIYDPPFRIAADPPGSSHRPNPTTRISASDPGAQQHACTQYL